jgi:hypothetical protein
VNYESIDHIIPSLRRYADNHIPTGGFLQAVLENNLSEACARADSNNRTLLFEIVSYCYNELPGGCWGSPERVQLWLGGAA